MPYIDWDTVAVRMKFPDEKAMWKGLYEERGLSIEQIANRFNVTKNTIRESLERCKITIKRKSVGSSPAKFTPEQVAAIKLEGIGKAARRMEVPYPRLYAQLRSSELRHRLQAKASGEERK